jgi:polyisoprenyl-phosphate glycosyltransferase
MIIGRGTISDRFADFALQSKYLVFAGSINDSSINDDVTIQQEERAVERALEEHADRTFLYFSSCSIFDTEATHTAYVRHKLRMEELVKASAKSYLIFRLPQLLALSDAKASLVNFLVDAIHRQQSFDLWQNAHRNLIDIDDVHAVVGALLQKGMLLNRTVTIASTVQTSLPELVHEIEEFLGVAALPVMVERGSTYALDVSDIAPAFEELQITFSGAYIRTSLEKYFGHLKRAPLRLSVIVPTYNEENGIDEFYRRTKNVLRKLSPRFEHEVIFVNDFSTDGTLGKLKLLAQADPAVKIINFSRNFGNQIGITAGIDYSQGDIAVVIDDDLQDPPEVILNFIAQWDRGYKVVYGVRPRRQGVNPLFRLAAKLYYRVIGSLSDTTIPNDTGDFRLIDRVVIQTLKKIREENRYYRGLVAWVGFPQVGVVYERDKRYAGVSTFSFKKYVNFALNGLTSFTEKPLYFSSLVGSVITLVSFILAAVLIIGKIVDPSISIRGWTSLTVIVLFFGGIQLFSIGILGVYISKIYREVKGRPLYIVEGTENLEHDAHER